MNGGSLVGEVIYILKNVIDEGHTAVLCFMIDKKEYKMKVKK